MAGIYRNEERQRKYLFSRPIYREELVVYARRGHAMAPYSGIASLYGKRVGVLALPLAIATGAGANSRVAIGTSVIEMPGASADGAWWVRSGIAVFVYRFRG